MDATIFSYVFVGSHALALTVGACAAFYQRMRDANDGAQALAESLLEEQRRVRAQADTQPDLSQYVVDDIDEHASTPRAFRAAAAVPSDDEAGIVRFEIELPKDVN